MRFRIRRTSNYGDTPPCEEAYTVPGEINPEKWWCDWYVNINTLEELLAFNKKHGDLVLMIRNEPTIEIYDTYRE